MISATPLTSLALPSALDRGGAGSESIGPIPGLPRYLCSALNLGRQRTATQDSQRCARSGRARISGAGSARTRASKNGLSLRGIHGAAANAAQRSWRASWHHAFRRFRTEVLPAGAGPRRPCSLWLGHAKETVTDLYADGLKNDSAWRRVNMR